MPWNQNLRVLGLPEIDVLQFYPGARISLDPQVYELGKPEDLRIG